MSSFFHKQLMIVALLALAPFVLTGCKNGGSGSTTGGVPPTNPPGPTQPPSRLATYLENLSPAALSTLYQEYVTNGSLNAAGETAAQNYK